MTVAMAMHAPFDKDTLCTMDVCCVIANLEKQLAELDEYSTILEANHTAIRQLQS